MLLKFNDPKVFTDAINIISELVQEVRIKVNKHGLGITAIDPANVALVMFKIPESAFADFSVGEEELGVNLADLKSILGRISAGSKLVMQKEENKLRIEILGKSKRTFDLSLIKIDSEEKQAPVLDFKSKVEISSDLFSEAIEDASVVADSCNLITFNSPESFVIEAKGPLNSSRVDFSADECKVHGKESSKYSLEYLQKFMKAKKLIDKVVINFATDYPCKIDFKSNSFELAFILAPRVETD
jgi:proliferating cell nuclear antigen PCNA